MLKFLSIRHLAIIDAVELEFDAGFNVLTGETGAGKSVLVDAVGLLVGGRASGDLVRTGEDAAIVEALFDAGGQELLVRREVTSQGRSRAFVNGNLTTAAALRELAAGLVELHGQHEHQTLLDAATHLGLLDAFGGLQHLSAPVHTAFDAMRAAEEALDGTRRAGSDRSARRELAAFQLAELDKAALKPREDDELLAARQVLASAERVERLCLEGYGSLYESDGAVLAALGGVWKRVGELAALDPAFQPFLDARAGIKSQLEELALFLRRYAEGIEASPARLEEVETRLALVERIKRKYGPTLGDALAKRDALRRELADLDGGAERLAELERARTEARDRYLHAAGALGRARRQVAADFARGVERHLGELAMERTRVEVRFAAAERPEAAWTAAGIDEAELFVSPNPGEELRPLARIVSGGELSRIMLAIKTLMATGRGGVSDAGDRLPGTDAPGLIFDEVDAGIGGRVADVVGRKLRTLGSAFQVVCITHLPQIAAYADTHFHIRKRVVQGRTTTAVMRLKDDDRIEELSRMLAGSGISDAIRTSAREMLRERQGGPPAGRGESERAKAKPRR
jgi:DNA repair protein RecN (Recombination protein N)